MSKQQAFKFVQRLRSDESFRLSCHDILKQVCPIEAIRKIASEHGYRFSKEDLVSSLEIDWKMRFLALKSEK